MRLRHYDIRRQHSPVRWCYLYSSAWRCPWWTSHFLCFQITFCTISSFIAMRQKCSPNGEPGILKCDFNLWHHTSVPNQSRQLAALNSTETICYTLLHCPVCYERESHACYNMPCYTRTNTWVISIYGPYRQLYDIGIYSRRFSGVFCSMTRPVWGCKPISKIKFYNRNTAKIGRSVLVRC